MNKTAITIVFAFSATMSTGCTTNDHTVRTEGVTLRSGDAIARNSVLQMVDPWPDGVEDTDLSTPADRAKADGETADGNEIRVGTDATKTDN